MASEKELQVVLAEKRNDLTRNVAKDETASLKNSLLFQYNWPDLLQSAPTSINSMGACLVAASAKGAEVTLDTPAKGFQYLKYTSVRANLMETKNLGMYAFNSAERGMGKIVGASDGVDRRLKDILRMMNDPESAREMLETSLQAVSRGAQNCHEAASEMERKFQDWLLYACEMHAACVQQETNTADVIKSNELCVAAEQVRLEHSKTSVQMAKDTTDLLSKQVVTSSEAFKKASDQYPSGWDIVGQQIVGDLASCATTAIKAAVPALVSAMNPTSKVSDVLSQGREIVGSFVQDNSSGPTKSQAPADNTSLKAPAGTDAAGTALIKDMTYITLLNIYVNGPGGNIDWEKAAGDGSDVKKTIGFVAIMLADAKTSISSIPSNSPSFAKVSTILDTVARVSDGILKVVNKNSSIASSWPAADSADVKQWISDFNAQYNLAQQITSGVATAHGGTSNTGILSDTPANTGDDLKPDHTMSQTILESAKNRLDITEKAYLATQENYLNASKILVEQQNKLADISASLTRLAGDKIKLAEVKKILIESIKLIIGLKNQINDLVRFFSAISVLIESVVKDHVTPFLDSIRHITSGDSKDPNAQWTIGQFTLTDLTRTTLFTAVLTIRTYFSIFSDIARMWIQLSIENIQPGLMMCDQISVANEEGGSLGKKTMELSNWSEKARNNIREITEAKQQEIMDTMMQRVQQVSATTALLSAPKAQKAIEEGKKEQTAAVTKALEFKKQSAPTSKWDVID